MIFPINLRRVYTDITSQVAGVEKAIQIYRGGSQEVLHGENRFKGIKLLYSDPGFFELFDLKLIEGNLENALTGINEVVITEKIARRIFGTDQAA